LNKHVLNFLLYIRSFISTFIGTFYKSYKKNYKEAEKGPGNEVAISLKVPMAG